MKKIIIAFFSLSLVIVILNYCKQEVDAPSSMPTKVEEGLESVNEREEPFKVGEVEQQEEEIKKLEILLNNLSREKNISVGDEALESLKPIYWEYGSDAIDDSLTSYLETYLTIDQDKRDFAKKDFERFLNFSFSIPIEPRPWGRLIVMTSPKADSVWIRGLGILEGKYDEKMEIAASPEQIALLKGLYEIIVYCDNSIMGNSNVRINAIKDDRKGTVLEYSFK